MIESLAVATKKPSKNAASNVDWACSLPVFDRLPNRTVSFKPGLNIIVGPNGSGKSAICSMLGLSLAAIQGGRSSITATWVNDITGFSGKGDASIKVSYAVAHDGQAAYYLNPRNKIGLMCGGLDDDFIHEGIFNSLARESSGEKAMRDMDAIIQILAKGLELPSEIIWKVSKNSANDIWSRKLDLIEKFLSPSIPAGQITVIMDEPESGLSLPYQAGFWQKVMGMISNNGKHQVIIASHSPFALQVEGAHYIETEAGHIEKCKNLFRPANQG